MRRGPLARTQGSVRLRRAAAGRALSTRARGSVAIHGAGLLPAQESKGGLSGTLHSPDSTECYRAAAAAALD